MELRGRKIHFMGIGGIGVSALAEMALDAGAIVSGCDRSASDLTRRLEGKGVAVFIGHDPAHVAGVDLLVHTSAVPDDHPERKAAGENQERRGRFLARFMEGRPAAGVSGTHGKTTTAWLLAHLLIHAGFDPAVFIGGIAPALPDGNFRLGKGPFVAELDESDATFLLPKLSLALITNIESDHLSHYRDDEALFAAFRRFAGGVAEDGALVAGIDGPVAAEVFARHPGRKISFGFGEGSDVAAAGVRQAGGKTIFTLTRRGEDLGPFALSLPGRHNVANALAALAAALEMGAPVEALRSALPLAGGVERRLEVLGTVDGAVLYSDYAHHPTEVSASVAALREKHAGRVLVVFQPHLYSRTRDYAEAFGRALAGTDATLLVDIYPAREEPIPGVDSRLIADFAARENGRVFGPVPLGGVANAVRSMAGDYEAVVMMGAGDIDAVARVIAERDISGNRR